MEQAGLGKVELICGIERPLLEEFLELIRDNYGKAEEAIYFLEESIHKTHSSPIANLRDCLSHFASFLSSDTPPARKRSQLENAEEHLRRAILEPYLITLGTEIQELKKLLPDYERELLPARAAYSILSGAPDIDYIRLRRREIAHLAKRGRAAKRLNLWNSSWEEGVAGLVEAVHRQRDLNDKIKKYWHEYQSILKQDQMLRDLAELRKEVAEISQKAPRSLIQVIRLAETALRKAFRKSPENEKDVQDAFETLLHGAEILHDREKVHIPYSTKTYVPDFTIDSIDLAIEIKLANSEKRSKDLLAEMNDDIAGYKRRYSNILFIVFDCGYIREVDRFKEPFNVPGVIISVVKL